MASALLLLFQHLSLGDPLDCSAAFAAYGLTMLPGISHTGQAHGTNWSGYGPAERSTWRAVLNDVREACRRNFDANTSAYADRRLDWTQTNFVSPQMHPYDRTFYDPAVGYTVDKYLADVEERYGGVDSILLWPTYPNIGVDNRNQIDLFRAMPGGLTAVRAVVHQLKARGVRVLLPYNPWDVGTRREGLGKISDDFAMADLIKTIGADGFNGDTMANVGRRFFDAGELRGLGIAIEPELMGLPLMSNYHTLGWAYWSLYTNATLHAEAATPRIDFYKWALDERWMSHSCERWSKNHTQFILHAYFNAVGFVSWENVWGTWNQMRDVDAELLRRAATIERFFGKAGFLTKRDGWEPHPAEIVAVPADGDQIVYGSRFVHSSDELVYFFVNPTNRTAHARITVASTVPNETDPVGIPPVAPGVDVANFTFLDCYRGHDVKMEPLPDGSIGNLRVPVEGLGLETWSFLPQTMTPSPHAPRRKDPPSSGSDDMVHIPATPTDTGYYFVCSGVEDEGDDAHGVDFQFPWESFPRREHNHTLHLPSFYIDRYPVTVREYYTYLQSTQYRPKDAHNWLGQIAWEHPREGSDVPRPRLGCERQPVTFVSLREARLYCKWRGARLPQTYEWQWAAQGAPGQSDPFAHNRSYPWGDDPPGAEHCPTPTDGPDNPTPADVDAHPRGGSAFGVQDLVGNIYQYTSEFQDAHTRAVALRGGSRFQPAAFNESKWYFPPAIQLSQHGKYLLFDDAYERAATIGFRCAADDDDTLLYF